MVDQRQSQPAGDQAADHDRARRVGVQQFVTVGRSSFRHLAHGPEIEPRGHGEVKEPGLRISPGLRQAVVLDPDNADHMARPRPAQRCSSL